MNRTARRRKSRERVRAMNVDETESNSRSAVTCVAGSVYVCAHYELMKNREVCERGSNGFPRNTLRIRGGGNGERMMAELRNTKDWQSGTTNARSMRAGRATHAISEDTELDAFEMERGMTEMEAMCVGAKCIDAELNVVGGFAGSKGEADTKALAYCGRGRGRGLWVEAVYAGVWRHAGPLTDVERSHACAVRAGAAMMVARPVDTFKVGAINEPSEGEVATSRMVRVACETETKAGTTLRCEMTLVMSYHEVRDGRSNGVLRTMVYDADSPGTYERVPVYTPGAAGAIIRQEATTGGGVWHALKAATDRWGVTMDATITACAVVTGGSNGWRRWRGWPVWAIEGRGGWGRVKMEQVVHMVHGGSGGRNGGDEDWEGEGVAWIRLAKRGNDSGSDVRGGWAAITGDELVWGEEGTSCACGQFELVDIDVMRETPAGMIDIMSHEAVGVREGRKRWRLYPWDAVAGRGFAQALRDAAWKEGGMAGPIWRTRGGSFNGDHNGGT